MWWHMNDAIRMQISAFVDGELPENEAEMLIRRMSQDAELRQQVADYLATGRLIRGERSVAGMHRLRDRIVAAVDERPLQEGDAEVARPATPRYVRALAGVAVAATVALAAIFGLQQTIGLSDQPDEAIARTVADGGNVEEIYTVPVAPDDMLREYYLSHEATSSNLGASGINARLVSLQLRQGVIVEADADDEMADDLVEEMDGESTNDSLQQIP